MILEMPQFLGYGDAMFFFSSFCLAFKPSVPLSSISLWNFEELFHLEELHAQVYSRCSLLAFMYAAM